MGFGRTIHRTPIFANRISSCPQLTDRRIEYESEWCMDGMREHATLRFRSARQVRKSPSHLNPQFSATFKRNSMSKCSVLPTGIVDERANRANGDCFTSDCLLLLAGADLHFFDVMKSASVSTQFRVSAACACLRSNFFSRIPCCQAIRVPSCFRL